MYVDPSNVHLHPDRHRQLQLDLGATPAEVKAAEAEAKADGEAMLAQMPPRLQGEWRFMFESMDRDPAEWVPEQPKVPTSVLLAGRVPEMPNPGLPPSVDAKAFFRAERALTREQFEARLAGIAGSERDSAPARSGLRFPLTSSAV